MFLPAGQCWISARRGVLLERSLQLCWLRVARNEAAKQEVIERLGVWKSSTIFMEPCKRLELLGGQRVHSRGPLASKIKKPRFMRRFSLRATPRLILTCPSRETASHPKPKRTHHPTSEFFDRIHHQKCIRCHFGHEPPLLSFCFAWFHNVVGRRVR